MTDLNATNLLRLIISKPNNSKPQIITDPNTPLRSDYTIKNTCRLLLKDQLAQTYCISSHKLRFIII